MYGKAGLAFALTVLLSYSASAGVLLSEVFYDTPGDDNVEEWVELFNGGSMAVDLSGYSLLDNNRQFAFPQGAYIQPASYLVVAKNVDGFLALYGYQPDYSGMSLSLGNSGDELTLKDASGNVLDYAAWEDYAAGWSISAHTGKSIVRDGSTWLSDADPTPWTGHLEGEITTSTSETTTTTYAAMPGESTDDPPEETMATVPSDMLPTTTTSTVSSSTTATTSTTTTTSKAPTTMNSTSTSTTMKATTTTQKTTTTAKTTSTTQPATHQAYSADDASASTQTTLKKTATATGTQLGESPAEDRKTTPTTLKKSASASNAAGSQERIPVDASDEQPTITSQPEKTMVIQTQKDENPPTGYVVSMLVLGASAMVSTISLVAVLLFLLTGRIKFNQ